MRKNYKVITANSTQPIDAATAKAFCKIDTSDDDAVITLLIESAKIAFEMFTNRFMFDTIIEQQQDGFEFLNSDIIDPIYNINYSQLRYIDLFFKPSSITSVKITDIENTETTLSASDYYTDINNRVIIKDSVNLSNLRQLASVKVTYTTGFGSTSASLPKDIELGIKAHVLLSYNTSSLNAKEAIAFDAFGLSDSVKSIYQKYVNINGI